MQLRYEGSDGTVIDLISYPIFAQNPEKLIENVWKYSTISGINGAGRVKKFWKDTQEAPLTLSIMSDSQEEFNKIMYRLHRTFDRDVRTSNPGRLWWNDWYREVYVVTTGNHDFDECFESIEQDLKVLSVNPSWIKERIFRFRPTSADDQTLDYNFDYAFDYGKEGIIEVIDNPCIDKANFEITFFGECESPSISIGGHSYGVLITLEEGEYVTINSLTRTITKVDLNGDTENVFYARDRDSYIFEPIPTGETAINKSRELDVMITLFDERGEPEWI